MLSPHSARAASSSAPVTVSPYACPADTGYDYSAVVATNLDWLRLYGGPGVTLTIQFAAGSTVTGTVGGQVKGDISLIVAGAELSVNASVALAKTVTATVGGAWTVPATQTGQGWFAAGATGYSMKWTYGRYSGTCQWVVLRSGTAKLPAHVPAFYHS